MSATSCDVSVVVPIRNEAPHIRRCLDSILGQEAGELSMEFLFVDGGSTDGTREIIAARCTTDSRLRLLENPDGRVSPALNVGLRASRGRFIVRMDAHSIYAPDYIAESVRALNETGAVAVGGIQLPIPGAETNFGRSIALVQTSPLGTGGARHRTVGYIGPATTLWLGTFRRDVLDVVSGFDESLFRSEDNDFYQRVHAAGGRLWLDSRIRASYVCRPTLTAYAKQSFVTGSEILPTLRRNPRAMALRHFLPGLMAGAGSTLLIFSATLTGPIATVARITLLASTATYGIALCATAVALARRSTWRLVPVIMTTLVTAHSAYAIGTAVGLLKAARTRSSRGPREESVG